jgi:thiol-disulfide isomerase/thioredoxin
VNLKKISLSFYFSILFILGQAQDKAYTVKLFLLDDCVICQSYTPLLNNLHEEFKAEFEFIGYFPNFRSKANGIKNFEEKYAINYELKTDYFKKETNSYNVKITPEVVVVDNANGNVLYQGRIDDEFISIGRRKRIVASNDLANALYQIRNGYPIVTAKTESVGCFINFDTFK